MYEISCCGYIYYKYSLAGPEIFFYRKLCVMKLNTHYKYYHSAINFVWNRALEYVSENDY